MSDLRRFISEQEMLGRVWRIDRELDPVDQASRELARLEGKIVILERVRGYGTPVVSGVVSSRELLASAVGAKVGEETRVMADRMDRPGEVRLVGEAHFLANTVEGAALDLGRLVPMLVYNPGSPRPYTSSSVIVARSKAHGINLSFHRMMYLGGNRFSVRVVPRHLRAILDESGGAGVEVAVIIGLHPAISLAAATSGPPEFSELAMAASLLGGLDVVDLGGLLIPAGAELVMLGRFTGELAEEGPFVDLTGTLDGVRQQPVLQIHRVHHREGFFFHSIVPGGVEHRLLMGAPQEPRILRAVANTFPRVRAVALTAGGCSWLHGAVSLERPRAGQARNVALAALGAHPSLKRVVVVDEDIDVHDPVQLEWAMATRVQPDKDVLIIPGARGSSLDPSRDVADNTTSKWIIDATIPADHDRGEFLRAMRRPSKASAGAATAGSTVTRGSTQLIYQKKPGGEG